MHVSTILDLIDLGSMALPEFQRGYVWNRKQVRDLMYSLYRRYPVGSLLVWSTKTDTADMRGEGKHPKGTVNLILDGQQRITTLYGIIRGKVPPFFEGNASNFTGLHFDIEGERFEFYSPAMKGNPYWVDVSELFQVGIGEATRRLLSVPEAQSKLAEYIKRLNAIDSTKTVDLHIEEVTGEDKTTDVVVNIFNWVNSGGTKLSKGDLALARVCAQWPEARQGIRTPLARWRNAGVFFGQDWFLRCVTTTLTGSAYYSALDDLSTAELQKGFGLAEKSIDILLNLVSSRLGLDHDSVLASRYSFPLMARYLVQCEGILKDHHERDRLLYWYVHTGLWGRYAGSTESTLNQDLNLIKDPKDALDRLIEQLRLSRGDLSIRPGDFGGWSVSARFYPFLYMMTRIWRAQDWGSGFELSSHLLGKGTRLELHHVSPKARLYAHGYSRPQVNAIANFTFLTQETNQQLSDRMPEDYFEEVLKAQPGALQSHWVPMDRELWKVERYLDFLTARRELLANAANEFLHTLLTGAFREEPELLNVAWAGQGHVLGGVGSPDEERILLDCNEWVVEQGLPEGEMMHELIDPDTGETLAYLDLAWPNGLQEGYSQPVALLVGEGGEIEQIVNQAGYRYFADVDAFHTYVRREILASEKNGIST